MRLFETPPQQWASFTHENKGTMQEDHYIPLPLLPAKSPRSAANAAFSESPGMKAYAREAALFEAKVLNSPGR